MGTWTSTTYERQDGSLHLSCAETAKLIRAALKKAFPGVKFRVTSKSYSMGASVTVGWTDGPTGSEVNEVTGIYSGAGFDGMIDLKTYNEHWLEPDGSATIAKIQGTTGSIEGRVEDPPTPNSRLVSFGADYVHTARRLSDERMEAARAEVCAFLGVDRLDSGKAYPAQAFFDRDDNTMRLAHDRHGRGEWGEQLVRQLASGRSYA